MPLTPPPSGAQSLATLDEQRLPRRMFRVWRTRAPGGTHRSGPWWFGAADQPGGGGRFDLPRPMGTCYLGRSPAAAVLEALQLRLLRLSTEDLAARRLAVIEVPDGAPAAADLAAPTGAGVGITAELWSDADRTMTQAWAQALRRDGWWALDYPIRHDPSATARAVALFDHHGAHPPTHGDWPYSDTALDDEPDVRAALAEHGIQVTPPGELPMVEPG